MGFSEVVRKTLRNSYRTKRLLFQLQFAFRCHVFGLIVFVVVFLAKVLGRALPVKVVSGWRASDLIRVDQDSCQAPLDQSSRFAAFGKSSNFSLAGLQPLPGESLNRLLRRSVQNHLPLTWPLELFVPFVSDSTDGNFNSVSTGEEASLANFRDDPRFHFLTPAIMQKPTDSEQFRRLLALGYNSEELLEAITTLDSQSQGPVRKGLGDEFLSMDFAHHYYYRKLRTLLEGRSAATVVEIGGGYGGLCRQVLSFVPGEVDRYVLVDIPMTLGLAQQYLMQHLAPEQFEKVEFIQFEQLVDRSMDYGEGSIIGVATHSLSELDPEIINFYLDKVIPKCTSFFVSMQRIFQNKYNMEWLYWRLLGQFREHSIEVTEGMNVINATLVLQGEQPQVGGS